MTKRRDWIKVRSAWWHSLSHSQLSLGAKLFGVFLMHVADGDPIWREVGHARICGPGMVARGLEDVARMAGGRLRDVRRWVAELIHAGTIDIDDSGCHRFPNYREHQENRTSRYRRDGVALRHNHDTNETKKSGEAEAEVEADVEAEKTCMVEPPRGGSPARNIATVEDAAQVAEWIAEARRAAGVTGATPPRVSDHMRKQVAKPMKQHGASLEDWHTAIQRSARSCQDAETARKYLTIATIHRPDNFGRLMERNDLDTQPTRGPGSWETNW